MDSTRQKQTMLRNKQISFTLLSMLYLQSGSINCSKCPDFLSNGCQCLSSQSTFTSVSCDFTNQSKPQTLMTSLGNESSTFLEVFRASIGKELNLPRNFFQGILSIADVDLSFNTIKDFPVSVFRLSEVKCLDLSHNTLTSLQAHRNMKLTVNSLNLSSNSIKFISRSFFRSFRKLQTLDLSMNILRTLPDQTFLYLHQMSYVDISHNLLQHISKYHFVDASNTLQVLKLNNNNLSDIDNQLFSPFSILRHIDLSYNIKIGSMELVNFPSHITQLDISMSGQSTLNYCNILSLKDLQTLTLLGNSIPCGCEILWIKQLIDNNREFLRNFSFTNSTLTCINREGNETNVLHDEFTCSDKMKSDYLSECGKMIPQTNRPVTMNLDQCKGEIDFQSSYESDMVSAAWNMGESCSQIFGYYLHIYDEDQKVVQDTVILHPTTTSFTYTNPKLCCGEITICLKVLLNDSYVFYEQCQTVYSFHTHMVVGILAGAIFLIPCAFVLVYVTYQDHKHRKKSLPSSGGKAVQNRVYASSHLIQLLRFCQYSGTDEVQTQDGEMACVKCKTEDNGMMERLNKEELRMTEEMSEEIRDRSGVSNISFFIDGVKSRPS